MMTKIITEDYLIDELKQQFDRDRLTKRCR